MARSSPTVPWEPSRLIHDCNGTGRETSAISHYLSLSSIIPLSCVGLRVPYMVRLGHRGQRTRAAENPLGLLPHRRWYRTGAPLVERIGRGRSPCDWERSIAGAVALAGGHAPVPSNGARLVGSPNGLARKSHGASVDLPLPGPPCGLAWSYQEKRELHRTMILPWRASA
jgi:hypothetical protein